jgi:uncharacterized protein YidB (DUF937 family)
MDEEKDIHGTDEREVAASSSPTVPGGDLEDAATRAAPDPAAGEGQPPQAAIPPSGGDVGSGGAKGGGFKGFFTQHKVLAGAVIGIMAVLIMVGMFIAGYYVGKPEGRHTKGPIPQQSQPYSPGPQQQPDLRPAPSPGQGGATEGLPGILEESREEIESEIATKLGISIDELQEGIKSGKTIAELAEEKGVAVGDLTGAVAAKISEIADRLAADGDITGRQAKEIKSNADNLATRFMERGRWRAPMPST